MNNKELAAKIKCLCKEKGITVKFLLEECNISRGFIYDLEKRNSTPLLSTLNAIADHLNISVDYLLGNTEQKEKPILELKDEQSIKLYNNIKSLSPEKVKQALDYVRYLASGQENQQK